MTKKPPAVIYALRDPRNGRVRYVGKSTKPAHRLLAHLSAVRRGDRTHRSVWLRGLVNEGLLPMLVTLEVVAEGGDWQERERFWIAAHTDLTNLLPGGEGGATYGRLGKRWSDAQRHNYTRARTGIPTRVSPEVARRRGEANRLAWIEKRALGIKKRGPTHTPETKASISAALKGRRLTEEHRAKLSAAKRGKPWSARRRVMFEAGRRQEVFPWHTA